MIANRIHLVGEYRHMEAPCVTALYPGMLLQLNSAGVAPHTTAGGFAERAFALEDVLQGNITSTQYGVGSGTYGVAGYIGPDMVQYALEMPGSEVNAMLAAGYAYTVGEKLISAGDGTLKPASASDSAVVLDQAVAIILPLPGTTGTGLDLSATGAVATLHPVRVR